MSLDPSKARKLMETLNGTQGRDEVRLAAEQALDFLLKQLEELRVLANGYPRNPIAGDVWVDGKALAELCDELTDVLTNKNLPRQTELASRLAVGMACQVMGHYPEQIFPRVLRNSRCREAIDDIEEAIGGYDAIINHFGELDLDHLLEEDDSLDEEGRTILASVYEAARRLGELRPERIPTLHDLQTRLQRRLAQEG